MGDSAIFRGCAAELNVFLEKRVADLEKELELSRSMYKVAIKERDYERHRVNALEKLEKHVRTMSALPRYTASDIWGGVEYGHRLRGEYIDADEIDRIASLLEK